MCTLNDRTSIMNIESVPIVDSIKQMIIYDTIYFEFCNHIWINMYMMSNYNVLIMTKV
jgi:hypothetical protein